jgi:phosphoglycolate phosphatase-like HAD superfamily hydrolase
MKLDAILWDYDGTLVNSVPKNIDVTKSILSIVKPNLINNNLPDSLKSEEYYCKALHAVKNWQELYIDYFGLSEEEVVQAGSMWTEYQEKNQTEVMLFDGIKCVIDMFSHIHQGICSLNCQKSIHKVLQNYGIDGKFETIVGNNEIPTDNQKPHPFGGIKCLENIFGHTHAQSIIYIGDHEADTMFARNLQAELGDKTRVISIAASYSLHSPEPEKWQIQPDHIAKNTGELATIIANYAG